MFPLCCVHYAFVNHLLLLCYHYSNTTFLSCQATCFHFLQTLATKAKLVKSATPISVAQARYWLPHQ